jgi:tRNA threonylcarbamoyladenosine biosynthesis protein TsaB
MLIVAIDTSGRDGSLALCRGSANSFAVLGQDSLAGRMYSAELMPKLEKMLADHSLSADDVQGIVAVSGPGSFTGLRVGLSTAKALAFALNIRIAAVTVLEALAMSAPERNRVVSALDAQRGEVYVGEYELRDGEICHRCESVQALSDFATWLKAQDPVPAVHTSDESLVEALRLEFITSELLPRPEAPHFGKLGFKKMQAGNTVSADALDADYLRKSDAELFSAPKLGITQRQ